MDEHETKRVSVVIPSRDGSETLRRALQSLEANAAFIREVLIVLSNSPAGYRAFCEELASAYRAHFSVAILDSGTQSNGAIARNLGIDASTGPYIAFLDDDDEWMPDKLSLYFRLIAERRLTADFVVFSTVVACHDDRSEPRRFPAQPYRGEPIAEFILSTRGGAQTSALLAPAELVKRVKFDPALVRHQDYDFCMRLEEAGAKFYAIDRPLSYWYQRGSALGKGATFEYCAQWITANQARVSRSAYIAYLEKELLAAARASGRAGDFLHFAQAQLRWPEQLGMCRRLLLRAGVKAWTQVRPRA
jgi:glycosyltransferase involved in cell wall biosynthesis